MSGVLEDVSLDGDTRLLNHARITDILKQIDIIDGTDDGYVWRLEEKLNTMMEPILLQQLDFNGKEVGKWGWNEK